MRGDRPSPLGALARGLAAGVLGTACMTAAQELAAKLQGGGGEEGGDSDERPADPWEQAPAPALVARRIARGVFRRDLPAERIGAITNAMHWGYGTSWGAVYGLAEGTAQAPALRLGLIFGAGVWVASYLQMVPMGLYEPPWTYAPKDVAMEVGYHLAYGAGVGAGYKALEAAR